MDCLFACAKAFERLSHMEYNMVIGRKGKAVSLHVQFAPVNFHHLAGLHKLRDLALAAENREKVFYRIIDKTITSEHIARSAFAYESHKRLKSLTNLEALFDANELIFQYHEKRQMYSVLQADFLLESPLENQPVYIFLSQKHNQTYFCRSQFIKEDKDYALGQTKYTLLYKEKVNMNTGHVTVQYDRLQSKK